MLDFSKKYTTKQASNVQVELFAAREGIYYGRYKYPKGGWNPGSWYEANCPLVEVKPKRTKTYWMLHFKDSGCCTIMNHIDKYQLSDDYLIAITGPHTITFEEGQDDRNTSGGGAKPIF